jgi:hypothetical protein
MNKQKILLTAVLFTSAVLLVSIIVLTGNVN